MPDAFISADADADALSESFLVCLGRLLALSRDILAVSCGFMGFLGISLVFFGFICFSFAENRISLFVIAVQRGRSQS